MNSDKAKIFTPFAMFGIALFFLIVLISFQFADVRPYEGMEHDFRIQNLTLFGIFLFFLILGFFARFQRKRKNDDSNKPPRA